MRRPPALSAASAYPVTAITGGLSIGATFIWWGQNDVSFLFLDFRAWEGQPWRLVTSVLLHANFIHLFFNLYWLWHFGTVVESAFGSLRTLGLFALLSAVPAAAEYAVFDGGVGLSGVNYGLFGLCWMRSHYDARFEGSVDRQTVAILVAWFFLCIFLTWAGVWRIGNVAHGMGLCLGLLLGRMYAVDSPRVIVAGWICLAVLVLWVMLSATIWRARINHSSHGGEDLAYVAYLKLQEQRPDEAERLLRRALEYNPREADWWTNLGSACFDQKHFADAAEALREAVRLNDRDARSWFNLAVALDAAGDWERAIEAYRKAAELHPKDPHILQALRKLKLAGDAEGK